MCLCCGQVIAASCDVMDVFVVRGLLLTVTSSMRLCCGQVIAADGEKSAARALKEAALVMNENPSALQLRYLQAIGHIATEKESTIYFPLPMTSPPAAIT